MMTDGAWAAIGLIVVALITNLGTLGTVILTARSNQRKLEDVKVLVDGHSTKQTLTIEAQTKTIADLSAAIAGRRNDD